MKTFFTRDSIQDITKINQLLLIVIEMEKEEILQWINQKRIVNSLKEY